MWQGWRLPEWIYVRWRSEHVRADTRYVVGCDTTGKISICRLSVSILLNEAAAPTQWYSGRENAAAGNISQFVLKSGKVHKSTMYSEGHSPCIESPLAAANSLQELLLQSWGGILRVFPSVPQ